MTIENQVVRLLEGVERLTRSVNSLKETLFLEKLSNWSPRDIVAHLIGWNRCAITGSKQIMERQLPFYDIDSGDNFSKVNAQLIRQYRSVNKEDLLNELATSAGELVEFLRSLDFEDWTRDYGVRNKMEILTIRATVEEVIVDYSHHAKQIDDWAAKKNGD